MNLTDSTEPVGSMFMWKVLWSSEKLISSSFKLFGLKISSAVKSDQRSDVSCFWDSWGLETSQVDTILPAPMFRLCMLFSIPINASGLISDHRKTSAALLFVSVWSKCCNNFDRQEDLHVYFCLTSTMQVLLSERTACLVTDFGEILTLQTDNGLFNVYPATNFVYWPLYE